MVKVDLTKKPYFLEKEDIQWVEAVSYTHLTLPTT